MDTCLFTSRDMGYLVPRPPLNILASKILMGSHKVFKILALIAPELFVFGWNDKVKYKIGSKSEAVHAIIVCC